MADKIAVLFGEYTLLSAKCRSIQGLRVLAGLREAGVDAHPVDPRDVDVTQLKRWALKRLCVAWSRWEDGTLQGLLELIPVALHQRQRDGVGDLHG